MNRRTFLKATALTIGLPALPTIASVKQEQQWIPLREQMPEVGQNIVMFDVWEGMSTRLSVGQVKSIYLGWPRNEYLGAYLFLNVDFRQYRYNHDGSLNGTYELTLNSNSANYSAREILNTPWVKTKRLTEFPMKPIPFYCKSNIKQWWIPAPDRIPQTLPPFAIDGQQWKLFSEHSPKQDDYVEIRGHRRWWIEKGWIKQGVSLPNKPIKNYIWLEKDHDEGVCRLIEINRTFWSWRYVS